MIIAFYFHIFTCKAENRLSYWWSLITWEYKMLIFEIFNAFSNDMWSADFSTLLNKSETLSGKRNWMIAKKRKMLISKSLSSMNSNIDLKQLDCKILRRKILRIHFVTFLSNSLWKYALRLSILFFNLQEDMDFNH